MSVAAGKGPSTRPALRSRLRGGTARAPSAPATPPVVIARPARPAGSTALTGKLIDDPCDDVIRPSHARRRDTSRPRSGAPPRGRRPRAALVLGHGAGGGVTAPDLVGGDRGRPRGRRHVALVEQPYRVAGRARLRRRTSSTRPGRRCSSSCARERAARAPARRRRPLAGARVACRTAEATGAVGVLCLAFPLGRRVGRTRAGSEPPPGARRGRRSDARRAGRERPVRDPPPGPRRSVVRCRATTACARTGTP